MIDPALLELLPREFALAQRVVPLRRERGRLVVGTDRPDDAQLLRWLKLYAGGPVTAQHEPPERLARLLAACYGASEEDYQQLAAQDLSAGAAGDPATRMVEHLLAAAIRAGASDIHFEPAGAGLRVRWRVDGVLRETDVLQPEQREAILTRLLLLAGIDIASRRRMQDGRARLVVGRRQLDLRVSSVPTRHGESVVLRILAADSGYASPADLGAAGEADALFRDAIGRQEGMVLFTGPTGSGKSTSIDTALRMIQRPDQKVVTIEDPVERIDPERTQIGVRAEIGFDFAAALRHVLRHDPDIIVVGEIRDRETAEVAFQAALSGHQVFSTLHTNSAPAAIPRLRSLGLAPGLVAAGLVAVLGQRLVRRCCAACAGTGCPGCGEEGYAGRTALFEVLGATPALRRAIREGAGVEQLIELAREAGYRPLLDDGRDKAAAGLTTWIEVQRVTGAL